jgi:hypothetical protein
MTSKKENGNGGAKMHHFFVKLQILHNRRCRQVIIKIENYNPGHLPGQDPGFLFSGFRKHRN